MRTHSNSRLIPSRLLFNFSVPSTTWFLISLTEYTTRRLDSWFARPPVCWKMEFKFKRRFLAVDWTRVNAARTIGRLPGSRTTVNTRAILGHNKSSSHTEEWKIHLGQLTSKPLQKMNRIIDFALVNEKTTPEFPRPIPQAMTELKKVWNGEINRRTVRIAPKNARPERYKPRPLATISWRCS